ncbi:MULTISPECIES: hypothetical protein [Lysinibacillus]|uniref:Uncharacterized protein n=1 Tax=Lysinibacillus antri TaxID=2498145 RepID=A0A432LD11_9BACI|nr:MULTISPECIES: hypothetical protein [Lysinibacillus]RUL54053.1 hypothetical protein EK386_07980 [Lysinibacillus antri]TSI02559.1 hypothetical protein FJQ64_18365 [Lysinibacillus sp. BW-2-10]
MIAWIFPTVNIMNYQKRFKYWITLIILSISVCSTVLFFQICSLYERVKAKDWAALEDTVSVIASTPAILLSGTIILNVITGFLYRKRTVGVEN